MLMFIRNCNKKFQCYIVVLQPKIQCYIGAATEKEPVCQAAQRSGGLPSVLIILLFLFNMMYCVQFRKKKKVSFLVWFCRSRSGVFMFPF